MVKYVLIVSQYYNSYVQKICMVQDDFVEKARQMVEELEDHKRNSHEKENRPVYYGDLDEKYSDSIKRALERGGRINLNDTGDIYFELSDSVDYLVDEIVKYGKKSEETYRISKRSKKIMEEVAKHHCRSVIADIIKKYFVVI